MNNLIENELINYLNDKETLQSLSCPHCDTFCKLYPADYDTLKFNITKNSEYGIIITIDCPNCSKTSAYFIVYNIEKSPNFNKYIVDKIISIKQIFPKEKAIAKTFPDSNIPPQLITLYEGMCDLSPINNNATAIWARKWVEKFIAIESSKLKKDTIKGNTLNEKITSFNKINDTTLDAKVLTALRRIGNKTIHIFSSNEDIEITREEAFLIIRNIEFIIDYYYVIPHNKEEAEKELLALENKVVEKANNLEKKENER